VLLHITARAIRPPSLRVVAGIRRTIDRGASAVAIIAPAGLLMGFGFPTGMRLVMKQSTKPAPWFWGINGAAGVLGSVMAVAVSISLGIKVTLIVGAFFLRRISSGRGRAANAV
jgi:hypothetical protein